MKKSKKAWKRTISILGILAAVAFLSLLFFVHLSFPVTYNETIAAASKKYDIDASLIRAVIWTESKYKKDAVSKKGAVGLMQLLPSTAEFLSPMLGYEDFCSEMLLDESVNINLGTYYLRYLLDKFEDEETMLAAYNAGEGNVQKWREKEIKTIPYKETRDYIKRVSLVKKIYRFKSK